MRTDMTKLIFTYRDFANAPENRTPELNTSFLFGSSQTLNSTATLTGAQLSGNAWNWQETRYQTEVR
jgi:hypothetical protein